MCFKLLGGPGVWGNHWKCIQFYFPGVWCDLVPGTSVLRRNYFWVLSCLDLPGLAWSSLDLPGATWTCLELPGLAWSCLVWHGYE